MSGDYTCVVFVGDREICGEAASVRRPVPLCGEHALEVALVVVPKVLSTALSEVRARNEDGTRPLSDAAAHVVSSAQPATWPDTERHSSLVYFVANGGRVKIGHTKGVAARIRALSLRPSAVMLLLHGGASLERALHEKFASHRIDDTEWFELAPPIVCFIGTKSHGQQHRQPTGNPKGQRGRIAAGVRQQMADGSTDAAAITARLSADLGHDVDLRTVKRLMRREREAAGQRNR
ncbi:GIY-YIG nuclease family protein [Streptomyces sp. NPDC001340]